MQKKKKQARSGVQFTWAVCWLLTEPAPRSVWKGLWSVPILTLTVLIHVYEQQCSHRTAPQRSLLVIWWVLAQLPERGLVEFRCCNTVFIRLPLGKGMPRCAFPLPFSFCYLYHSRTQQHWVDPLVIITLFHIPSDIQASSVQIQSKRQDCICGRVWRKVCRARQEATGKGYKRG